MGTGGAGSNGQQPGRGLIQSGVATTSLHSQGHPRGPPTAATLLPYLTGVGGHPTHVYNKVLPQSTAVTLLHPKAKAGCGAWAWASSPSFLLLPLEGRGQFSHLKVQENQDAAAREAAGVWASGFSGHAAGGAPRPHFEKHCTAAI